MIEIKGKYATAQIYSNLVDELAIKQLQLLIDQPLSKDAKIRIMPDVHAGAGCVIGFTANIQDVVIPNIVGVDIGCGMLTIMLGQKRIDLDKLDAIIHQYIPSGRDVHVHPLAKVDLLSNIRCLPYLKNEKRFSQSMGTLGGGNHFIEVNVDDEGNHYLVIHTGSRNLGKQVADYYQHLAIDQLSGKSNYKQDLNNLIAGYKQQNKEHLLEQAIQDLKAEYELKMVKHPELSYLTGQGKADYLNDMGLCQQFATRNREKIASIILNHLFEKSLHDFDCFETVHNYIDLTTNMIRKGAVSAQLNEMILIPMNMRDGSLLCLGKGNEDWNCSAPHGAGRLYSRIQAKKQFTLDEYALSMKGIYSSTINNQTLDECPMAYKDMKDIVTRIEPTATILKVLKPIYNFKASD